MIQKRFFFILDHFTKNITNFQVVWFGSVYGHPIYDFITSELDAAMKKVFDLRSSIDEMEKKLVTWTNTASSLINKLNHIKAKMILLGVKCNDSSKRLNIDPKLITPAYRKATAVETNYGSNYTNYINWRKYSLITNYTYTYSNFVNCNSISKYSSITNYAYYYSNYSVRSIECTTFISCNSICCNFICYNSYTHSIISAC